MAYTYYRPKRKADLIRHLREDHARDHVVGRPEGGTRLGTATEIRNLYNVGWTVDILTARYDMFHAERGVSDGD